MKYIVIEQKTKELDRVIPIIFPDALVHKDVYESVVHMLRRTEHPELEAEYEVYSAGSCDVKVQCSGKSETLGVESLIKGDDSIINMYDYTHGLTF